MGRGADPVYDCVGHDSRRNPSPHAGALRVPHLPHQIGEQRTGSSYPGGTGQRPVETVRDLSGHAGRSALSFPSTVSPLRTNTATPLRSEQN